MSNWKLKKKVEKGNLEEIDRILQEMSLVDPNSEEYKKLSERHAELSKVVSEKTTNDVKTRNVLIDNGFAIAGILVSLFCADVFGRIPSPQTWTFGKSRQKHNN